MSCNYAENLSHYEYKGKLGLPEKFDSDVEVQIKSQKLANWLKESKHTVVHTGAGVSTAAGIPDFRGPNGVWTLEKEGKKPSINISWDDAKPTVTHMALLSLQKAGYISYIITQNIDGLHLRSGLPRSCLAELHGNLFVDKCNTCQRQFVRHGAVETVGLKSQGVTCPGRRANGRRCRGKLHDTILDWEDSLPDADLELSHMHSCLADLSLCLGTTLQIVPSGNLPVHTKKRGGKLVICNLQPTKQDKYADLLIHTYVDDVLKKTLKILQVPLLEYDESLDPVMKTKNQLSRFGYSCPSPNNKNQISQLPGDFKAIDWSIPEEWVKDKDLINKSKSKKIIKRSRTDNNGKKEMLSETREKKAKISVNEIKEKKIKNETFVNGNLKTVVDASIEDETPCKVDETSKVEDKTPSKVDEISCKVKDETPSKFELDDKTLMKLEFKNEHKVKNEKLEPFGKSTIECEVVDTEAEAFIKLNSEDLEEN